MHKQLIKLQQSNVNHCSANHSDNDKMSLQII